jgi:LPXTG-motif cell wall-anchored protein
LPTTTTTSPNQLPRTGNFTEDILGIGAGIVLLGGGSGLVVGRRRRGR